MDERARQAEAIANLHRGEALFDGLVRGDALIGLLPDTRAAKRDMADALWAAAVRGSARAYLRLGDAYRAFHRAIGAFDGLEPDTCSRPWSADSALIVDRENASIEAALRAYRESARLGMREAIVAFARSARESSPENLARALTLFEGLVDPAADELYERGLLEFALGDFVTSARTHEAAADAGSADAQFELYVYHARGIGVAADAERADVWLRHAVEQNHPRALYSLGATYASGERGAPDMDVAARHYVRAANLGHGRAAATLAVMILQGAIEGDEADAKRWLDTADANGFASWELLDAVGFDDPREHGRLDDRDEDRSTLTDR
jgi:TPR repeat protein